MKGKKLKACFVFAVLIAGSISAFFLPVDSDGDGMPDLWEIVHGFNPHDPTDACEDADGDGLTNVEEFLAGTDPRDASSAPKISSIDYTANTAQISFFGISNKTYTVEYKNSLAEPSWALLAEFVQRQTG